MAVVSGLFSMHVFLVIKVSDFQNYIMQNIISIYNPQFETFRVCIERELQAMGFVLASSVPLFIDFLRSLFP